MSVGTSSVLPTQLPTFYFYNRNNTVVNFLPSGGHVRQSRDICGSKHLEVVFFFK
jgi:hypothetical protein